MKKIISILVLAAGCAALGVLLNWSYFEGYWRFNYPDLRTYPVAGIDISHHQGDIRWSEVPKLGFVFIKATEGGDFKDPRFEHNWKEAGRAGLLRGAYHFFTFRKPGAEQAENFIASVPVENDALPPAVDFEFGGNSADRPAREALLKEMFEFLTRVEKTYGKRPIIYATYEAYDQYLKGAVDAYPLWVRDIFWEPSLPDKSAWAFWQYANNGRVSGIEGRTDLNVFAGTQEKFEKFLRQEWAALDTKGPRANKQNFPHQQSHPVSCHS